MATVALCCTLAAGNSGDGAPAQLQQQRGIDGRSQPHCQGEQWRHHRRGNRVLAIVVLHLWRHNWRFQLRVPETYLTHLWPQVQVSPHREPASGARGLEAGHLRRDGGAVPRHPGQQGALPVHLGAISRQPGARSAHRLGNGNQQPARPCRRHCQHCEGVAHGRAHNESLA